MEQKNRIAERYTVRFDKNQLVHSPPVPGIRYPPQLVYLYCCLMDPSVDRDTLVQLMHDYGVNHQFSFPPIPLQPVYLKRFSLKAGDFSRAEAVFARFVNIPAWVSMSDDQIDNVVQVVSECPHEVFS